MSCIQPVITSNNFYIILHLYVCDVFCNICSIMFSILKFIFCVFSNSKPQQSIFSGTSLKFWKQLKGVQVKFQFFLQEVSQVSLSTLWIFDKCWEQGQSYVEEASASHLDNEKIFYFLVGVDLREILKSEQLAVFVFM